MKVIFFFIVVLWLKALLEIPLYLSWEVVKWRVKTKRSTLFDKISIEMMALRIKKTNCFNTFFVVTQVISLFILGVKIKLSNTVTNLLCMMRNNQSKIEYKQMETHIYWYGQMDGLLISQHLICCCNWYCCCCCCF